MPTALVNFLATKDQNGWNVSHRQLFGAPMLESFMCGGWTCHLAIHDAADSPEHHVDLFGIPPRLAKDAWQADYGGLLNRSALAQMKKTDRAKDWPFINSLALQALEQGDPRGLLHLREPSLLIHFSAMQSPAMLQEMSEKRPLLGHLKQADDLQLERLLLIEETIWQAVNRERYQVYQREWKDFYHRWREAEPGAWPTDEAFADQHARLNAAAEIHHLPHSPLGGEPDRRSAYDRGIKRATSLTHATAAEVAATLPPLTVILP